MCGTLNLIKLLPLGEVCSMTVAQAGVGASAVVAHISVDNTLQSLGTSVPVYDYMPETIQPSFGEQRIGQYECGSGHRRSRD